MSLFLGVGGIDAVKGLTEYNLDDTRVKRAALGAAARCVVLADRSKLARVCLAQVATLEEIDVLITDAEPPTPCSMRSGRPGSRSCPSHPTSGRRKNEPPVQGAVRRSASR